MYSIALARDISGEIPVSILNCLKGLTKPFKCGIIKYNGRVRDYGGSDYGFKDQILDEYFVVDLGGTYNLWNTYSLDFKLINLFDKEYEQAFLFQGPPRELNIGLRKSF